jgi:mRNA-degrading endonuclease toxin of MazEF toxin-antitoxin module
MTPPIRQGRIVWVEMFDPQGRNPKVRPAVVVTKSPEIRDDGNVTVVAVTSQTLEAPVEVSVLIPWQNGGHPKTKLDRRCAAVCSWSESVPVSSIVRVGGIVPLFEMGQIVKRFLELQVNLDVDENE